MKIEITLNDITAFGRAWEEIKEKTFGKQTTKVYLAIKPFIELIDEYRKAKQAYIKEHIEEGQTKIPQFDSVTDHDGNEIPDETKEKMGLSETKEWVEFQEFHQEQMSDIHEFEVTPVLEETQGNKLNANQLHVFNVLGLLVLPKEEKSKNEEIEDEED
tara:strand:+ start:850 stop:1326 length:477 start_codon:yes stop_codon:yes gene_type:complete